MTSETVTGISSNISNSNINSNNYNSNISNNNSSDSNNINNNFSNSVNSIIFTSVNTTIISPTTNSPLNSSIINNTATNTATNTVINTVISGKIANCNTIGYFQGANIQVKSLSNQVLATAISDSNGDYKTSFYSLDYSFNVIASYPGHVTPITNVNFNVFSDNINSSTRYGIASLKLGTLTLTKGSNDILTYDSNDFSTGPSKFLIQIAIKNNAATTATNVWTNLTWLWTTNGIKLAPNETGNHFIGNISSGQTVYTFYEISLNSPVNKNAMRMYNIAVAGTNTASPQDTIIGTLIATDANSQNRNHWLNSSK